MANNTWSSRRAAILRSRKKRSTMRWWLLLCPRLAKLFWPARHDDRAVVVARQQASGIRELSARGRGERAEWQIVGRTIVHLYNPPVVRWGAVKGLPQGRSS